MIYTILITAHPDASDISHQALSYCEALVARGDRIKQVFFMHEANYIAVHPSAQQWSAFAVNHMIDLQTCVSTAEQQSIRARDYAAGFQQGGLSALADSILSTDEVAQFGVGSDALAVALKCEPGIEKKQTMFIFQSLPEESSVSAEGVDLLLVLSAFEANVKVVFKGGGINNILSCGQRNKPRYTKRFKALKDFDVNDIYAISDNDIDAEISYDLLSEVQFRQMMSQSHVLRF